jgi:nitronate monooxygenase
LAQKYNAKVLAQVGTVQEAMEAVDAGVDGLIVQGSEAGGHGVRRELGNATLPLAITVITKLRAAGSEIPVIAAGGIVNGRGMAAMLVAGCDGVVLGTRLWASQESIGMQQFKDRLVAATSCDDVVRTTCFDWIQNTYSAAPWPEPFDSVGALRNQTSATWEGRADELALELQTKDSVLVADYRRACKEGNADIALVHAGEGVGLIDAIEPAYDIVTRISNEAADVIRNSPKQLLDE